jgi:hypothetical protein
MKLRPSLLSLILGGLLHAAEEEVADFAPKEFSLSSYAHGGGSGGTTTVTFRDGVLTRKSEYSGFAAPKNRTETATPTPERWREFRSTVDKLNIWQWKSHYKSTQIPGGSVASGWSLTLHYRDRKLRSSGQMRSPDNFQELGKAIDSLFEK